MSELVCKTLELLAETKGSFVSAVKNIFNTRTMATLKISDLSVGDWVMVEWPDGERWRGRLTQLSVTGGVEVCCANGKHVRCSSDFISSIPITAEMLENNGFVRSSDEFPIYEYTTLLGKMLRTTQVYLTTLKSIKVFLHDTTIERGFYHREKTSVSILKDKVYIHELQHALRLAGLDKEINL